MVLGSDGTIAIIGRAYYDGSNYGIHLTKLTQAEGGIVLSRVYHYTDIDGRSAGLTPDPSGGLIIHGRGKIPPSTQFKGLVFKVDDSGDVQWSTNLDDNIAGDELIYIGGTRVTSTGDIIVVGYLGKPSSASSDTFLAKLNGSGQLQWMRSYGFPSNDFKSF